MESVGTPPCGVAKPYLDITNPAWCGCFRFIKFIIIIVAAISQFRVAASAIPLLGRRRSTNCRIDLPTDCP